MKTPKIKDIKVIFTEPDNIRLVVVKVLTDQDGLYGVGCATFTQRPIPVKSAIEDYLKPFLIGSEVSNIEDIWYALSGEIICFLLSSIEGIPSFKYEISLQPLHFRL